MAEQLPIWILSGAWQKGGEGTAAQEGQIVEARKQFTFYESFRASIKRIKKAADRALAYDAICDYALYGIEPNLDNLPDTVAIIFESAKPNLDTSRRKAEVGRVGGNRKQSGSKTEANEKQIASKTEANRKQSGSEKEIEKEIEIELEIEKEIENDSSLSIGAGAPVSQKRFSIPSVQEVSDYCRERGNGIDAEAFVDFYASKGWKVGNTPMKDWKSAVRTWEKREPAYGKKSVPTGGGELGEAEMEAIRRAMREA